MPFTLNGFAVREAFFVSFLGSVGVERRRRLRGRLPLLPRHGRARAPRRGDPALGVGARRAAARGRAWLTPARDVGVVVTTHNALPWIEQCLASVDGVETVVVDNGSSDDTVAFVRERFPAVTVIEQANRGLAAGWARGLEELPERRWALILNADAWLVGDALERMVALGERAAGRRRRRRRSSSTPTASLQRSVRGFPTRWRLATEYYYLRKLGAAHASC